LAPADVEHYTRERRAGRLTRRDAHAKLITSKPVRDRVLEEDLTFLRTVIRWATRKRKDATGAWFLSMDPLGEFDIPRERDPRRPMLAAGEYELVREKAAEMDRRVWLALVLCHETGRRLNSVRQLRWADVDLTSKTLRWIGERQKNGQTNVTPMTDALAVALRQARIEGGTLGDGWLFPSSRSDEAIDRKVFYNGWRDVRKACGLPMVGAAFHAQRRQMASDLASAPLAVVAELGGWKHPEVALKVYQQANVEQQRAVLDARERYRRGA
jgi:integrase